MIAVKFVNLPKGDSGSYLRLDQIMIINETESGMEVWSTLNATNRIIY